MLRRSANGDGQPCDAPILPILLEDGRPAVMGDLAFRHIHQPRSTRVKALPTAAHLYVHHPVTGKPLARRV